jgi:hypothetical protein
MPYESSASIAMPYESSASIAMPYESSASIAIPYESSASIAMPSRCRIYVITAIDLRGNLMSRMQPLKRKGHAHGRQVAELRTCGPKGTKGTNEIEERGYWDCTDIKV